MPHAPGRLHDRKPAPKRSARRDQAWQENADALKAFHDSHGLWPAQDSRGRENTLADWRGTQRGDLRHGRMPQDRRDWLDQNLPGWAGNTVPVTPEEMLALRKRAPEWLDSAKAVAAFKSRHGRLPSQTRSRGGEELVMGSWLLHQRTRLRRGQMRQDRKDWLDENLPGWAGSIVPMTPEEMLAPRKRAPEWHDSARAVAAFHSSYRRLPAQTRSRGGQEFVLATWLTAQRAQLRARKLSDDRKKWLDEHLPGWRTPCC